MPRIEYDFSVPDKSKKRDWTKLFNNPKINVYVGHDGHELVISRWRHETTTKNGYTYSAPKLEFAKVRFLQTAIRLTEHVIKNCQKEAEENLEEVTEKTRTVWQFFISYKQSQYSGKMEEIERKILDLISSLGPNTNIPEMQQAQNQMMEVIKRKGKDKLGRPNPKAMAARMISAISHLELRETNALGSIIADYSMRQAALKTLLDSYKRTYQNIIEKIKELRKEKAFETRRYQSDKWLNYLRNEIKRMKALVKRFELEPFWTIREKVEDRLKKALEWVDPEENMKMHLKVKKILRVLQEYLETPNRFPQIKSEINGLINRVKSIRNQDQPDKTELGEIKGRIAGMFTGLEKRFSQDPFQAIIEETAKALQKAANYFKQRNYEKTIEYLKIARRRVDW